MNHYQAIAANKRKSWLIIGLFTSFIAVTAYLMAVGFGYGLDVGGVALIFSGVMSFAS